MDYFHNRKCHIFYSGVVGAYDKMADIQECNLEERIIISTLERVAIYQVLPSQYQCLKAMAKQWRPVYCLKPMPEQK